MELSPSRVQPAFACKKEVLQPNFFFFLVKIIRTSQFTVFATFKRRILFGIPREPILVKHLDSQPLKIVQKAMQALFHTLLVVQSTPQQCRLKLFIHYSINHYGRAGIHVGKASGIFPNGKCLQRLPSPFGNTYLCLAASWSFRRSMTSPSMR